MSDNDIGVPPPSYEDVTKDEEPLPHYEDVANNEGADEDEYREQLQAASAKVVDEQRRRKKKKKKRRPAAEGSECRVLPPLRLEPRRIDARAPQDENGHIEMGHVSNGASVVHEHSPRNLSERRPRNSSFDRAIENTPENSHRIVTQTSISSSLPAETYATVDVESGISRPVTSSGVELETSLAVHGTVVTRALPPIPTAFPGRRRSDVLTIDQETTFTEGANGGSTTNVDVERANGGTQDTATSNTNTHNKSFLGCLKDAFSSETISDRRSIIIGVTVGLCLLLLFLILFPISFVRLEYHQIALMRYKTSKNIDRSTTYYPGCYVLGPDTEFVIFKGHVHTVELDDIVHIHAQLEVDFKLTFYYFIRPEELGELFTLYGYDYEPIISSIALANVKITMTDMYLDDLRLQRAAMEKKIYVNLAKKLGGNCCLPCCSTTCPGMRALLCDGCTPRDQCVTKGHHVEVRYFMLGVISGFGSVQERLLRQVLLQENRETEHFIQDYTVEQMESEKQVQVILNTANEIDHYATNNATKILAISQAESDAITETAIVDGLDAMCTRIGLTDDEHRMTVLYVNTLSAAEHIRYQINYENGTMYQGAGL